MIVPDGSLAKIHPAFAPYSNLYVEAGQVGLSDTLVKPNNRDFAPRLGASYRVSPRTVLRGNFGMYYVDYTANSFQDALNAPPFVRRAQLTRSQLVGAGAPVNSIYTFQNPSADGSDAGAAAQLANLVGTTESYPTQRSYSWNVTVEQEIGWSTGVRASYVGNLSRHLSRNVRVNACPPGPTECLQRAANAADGRRWTAFNTNMGLAANDGDANYHGLELEVQRRMSDGLLFNANYTVASLNGFAADATNPVSDPYWDYDWGPIGRAAPYRARELHLRASGRPRSRVRQEPVEGARRGDWRLVDFRLVELSVRRLSECHGQRRPDADRRDHDGAESRRSRRRSVARRRPVAQRTGARLVQHGGVRDAGIRQRRGVAADAAVRDLAASA